MIRIETYQPADLPAVTAFVAAIQEHERAQVAELKPGHEIGADYARLLLTRVAERNGTILMARVEGETIGFACGWMAVDDDPLLREDARPHATVSDLFVAAPWCGRGVARMLLAAIEREMRQRGCRQIRVTAKATNREALACYDAAGYGAYEVILWKPLDKVQ